MKEKLFTKRLTKWSTVVDGSGKNGVCHVTIGYIPSVRTLNYTKLELELFKTAQLVLTFDNENASYKEITWSSSDAGVASVDANGLVTANGNGTAIISATTGEGSVECTVVVNGGVTYFNDFEDATNNEFLVAGQWTKVQEEDGNQVLDFIGTNLTSSAKHLTGADSGTGAVLVPGATSGFVVDFSIKRMTDKGHQAINLRIGTSENKNIYRRVNLNKLTLNEWYDMKIYFKGGEATIYWKKASESTWQVSADWWSGASPLGNSSAEVSTTVKKNCLVIYPYIVSSSDDKSLANAQLTHIRMDNIKVSSPVSATGFDIAEDNINLAVGETAVLTNIFTPSNATDTHVTYTSSDVNVATVDKYGKVTAVANGSAVITVIAADGGFVDTVDVTVGAIVPELSVKKEVTEGGFKFTVTSNVALDAAMVYVAAYDSSDRMLGAVSGNYIADGTEIPMNVSNAAYFKVFAWDASAKAAVESKMVE